MPEQPENAAANTRATDEKIKGAFGAKNRARLIEAYFAERGGTHAPAFEDVYRLLLWIDQTTGLAHCYESDKSQPGKPWYARSLAFHHWVATSLDVTPKELAEHVDWLFRRAASDLAAEVVRNARKLSERATRQRQPFAAQSMPQPGEDPGLVVIVREVLGDHLSRDVPDAIWQALVQRVRQYLTLENKRKNLVGEGFEDVLAATIRRAPGSYAVQVFTRPLLHELPGFNRSREGEKPNKVDVALVKRDGGMRTLVTAKWSIRADREKQFAADHHDYVLAESDRRPFDYVCITNEFDPARLMRACDALIGNAFMFKHVVHINVDALRATYGAEPEASMKKVLDFADAGDRLIGLDRWLQLVLAK